MRISDWSSDVCSSGLFGLVRAGGCFINADNVRATTKTLGERYRNARDEYLDRFVRHSSGGKTTLAELRAAAPSTYHGPHKNGFLAEETGRASCGESGDQYVENPEGA